MNAYYALWVGDRGSDAEGLATVPHMIKVAQRNTHRVEAARVPFGTRLAYTHKGDRDHAKQWLRQWAHQQGLDPTYIQ